MAVRMSIGAARRRLLRQLLTESVLLSLAGGVLGVLFAFVAIRSIVSLMPEFYVPERVARHHQHSGAAVLAGGVAAHGHRVRARACAADVEGRTSTDALRAGRSTGAGATAGAARNLLVIVEVALSVVLLVSAGLTIRTFFALSGIDPGIQGGARADRRRSSAAGQIHDSRSAQSIRAGIAGSRRHAAGRRGSHVRPAVRRTQSPFRIVGAERGRLETNRRSTSIGADHLRTFGIPLRAGRMFDAAEIRRGDRVAVINEAAMKLWPAGENPIGARMRLERARENPPAPC